MSDILFSVIKTVCIDVFSVIISVVIVAVYYHVAFVLKHKLNYVRVIRSTNVETFTFEDDNGQWEFQVVTKNYGEPVFSVRAKGEILYQKCDTLIYQGLDNFFSGEDKITIYEPSQGLTLVIIFQDKQNKKKL